MKPKSDRLRIAIDFPWDATACMGTGAYSETMVRALAEAAPRSTLTLIVPIGTPRRIQLPNVVYASLPPTEGLAEGMRQVALPAYLEASKADCLFSPASLLPTVKVCPTVATVHDLAFETHSEHYAPGLVDYLRRWFPTTLEGADRIVAISDPVKQDLLFRKRIDPARVTVIEQPIRRTFFEPLADNEAAAELERLSVATPFFFHVSNLSAHKNMEFGVRAFAAFLDAHPGARHRLVFAGGSFGPSVPPDLLALARSMGIGNRVSYVGKVSDTALKALYQRCEAFLFPSLVEGWGLPVVEARTLGAPVLASPHVPSAGSEERIPLELGVWAGRLGNPGERQVPEQRSEDGEAGRRLLDVIREAIDVAPPRRPRAAEGRPPSKLRIAIRGDWHSPSGLAEAARSVCLALESADLHPTPVAAPKDSIQDKRLWRRATALAGDADLWIHHLPPDHFDLSLPGRHASFFFWETDRLPTSVSGCDWAALLSRLDEVWAPSTFTAEVLQQSGVTAPVCRIFPPVDMALYSPGPRRAPPVDLPTGFGPSWTVILYVGTWDPRKRPDVLVRSFSRAFSPRDHALLLIKSYVTGDPARDREILGRWVQDSRESDAHVRVLPQVLSAPEMADLFRFATAFATASRGEGYCLPAVQALSTARPVVASGWSAFADYPILAVDHRIAPIPRQVALPGYAPDQRWAEILEEDLARKLRWIHENREQASLLGQKGLEWVTKNASMTVAGKLLRDRILALCTKNPRLQPLEVVT